jgi:hypothetical protein
MENKREGDREAAGDCFFGMGIGKGAAKVALSDLWIFCDQCARNLTSKHL